MGSKYFSFVLAGAIVFIVISIFAASCKSGGALSSPAAESAVQGERSANPYVAPAEPMPPEVFTGGPDCATAEWSGARLNGAEWNGAPGIGETGESAARPHPKTLVTAEKSPLGLEISVIESAGSLRAENLAIVQTRTGEGYAVELSAVDAKDVSQALFEVRFDTTRYRVSGWRIGEFLAEERRGGFPEAASGLGKLEQVEGGASVLKAAGALCALIPAADHAGVAVARINPEVRGSASGNGRVCTLEFSPGAARLGRESGGSQTGASTAEYRGASAETGGGFWDWKYGTIMPYGKRGENGSLVIANGRFPGDADRNFEVSIADITPIAQQYEKTIVWHSDWIADGVSPFKVGASPNDPIANADLDRNGEVGISDITIIANNYNRLYYPLDLARRESSSGNWQVVSQLKSSQYGDSLTTIDLLVLTRAKIKSFLPGGEYGISFLDQTTGLEDALPLVRNEFDGFIWDNYFGQVIAADVELKNGESERRLVVEFDILGDYDCSGRVNVGDITGVPLNSMQLLLGNFSNLAMPHLQAYIQEYASWGYSLDPVTSITTHILPIRANYIIGEEKLELLYFETPALLTPIYQETVLKDIFPDELPRATWIYPNRKVIAVPAPPVYGTLFVEATMVLDYLGDEFRIEKPGRHEVYFPPPPEE